MGFSTLLFYGVLAIPFVLLGRLSLVRKLTGFSDIRKSHEIRKDMGGWASHTIARFGKPQPDRVGDYLIFGQTIGARLVNTLLISTILLLLFAEGVRGLEQILSAAVLTTLAIWWMVRIWRYRVVLFENELHNKDWRGRHQSYDLAQLARAEYDGTAGYRLEFEDGRRTYVNKFIDGHAVMRDFLIHALETNKR